MYYDYGGRRDGAGRKSTWASKARKEDSKLVRVPGYIASEVLKAAHYIDAGGVINYNTFDLVNQLDNRKFDSVTQSNTTRLDRLTELVERYKSQAKDTRDWSKANKLIGDALAIINEIAVNEK